MKNKIAFLLLLCLTHATVVAQKVDVDELLKQANYESNVTQNYANAITLAEKALQISPNYIDIRLLLGKLYRLTDQLVSAKNEYNKVLAISPNQSDALAALAALAAEEQAQRLKDLSQRIGITYNPTFFEKEGKQTWNLGSVYYVRTEKFGSLVGRINYLDRAYANGYQFELEAYPKHKKAYSMVNFAYSNSAVFQKYRLSYSYIRSFNHGWEGELGIRYQYKLNSLYSYGAGIGKYLSNHWFNLQAFVTPSKGKIAQSYTLTSRFYLDTPDDYVVAIVGTGISPDDRTRNINFNERINSNSLRLSLGFQKSIWSRNLIGILGTYNKQAYVRGRYENEYDFSINFQHRF